MVKDMADKHHISDEQLAAYLDGNLNMDEMREVLQAAEKDDELRATLEIAANMEDEEWQALQIAAEGGRNLCDIQCEAYVLRHCGIDCETEELLEVAKENHWIRRAGTPLSCIGNLIEYKGLSVKRKFDATLDDVSAALRDGCGVIVAVDSDKLYPERPDEEDATNHAIVVVGVSEDKVTIYDPGNAVEIDIGKHLFVSAWHESHYYTVSVK